MFYFYIASTLSYFHELLYIVTLKLFYVGYTKELLIRVKLNYPYRLIELIELIQLERTINVWRTKDT